MKEVRIIEGLTADRLPVLELIEEGEPALLKGVVSDWPLVRKGLEGQAAAIAYLTGFDAGRPVVGYVGPLAIGGRFFYNGEMTGLNFEAKRVGFSDFLARIAARTDDAEASSFYIGSTDIGIYLRSPARTTISPTTSPATWSAAGVSRCFRPIRSRTSIPVRWSRRPVDRSSVWSIFAIPTLRAFRAFPPRSRLRR